MTVGGGGSFECDSGSTCTLTVDDPSAVVECTDASVCDITCKSACSYSCKKMATCHVKCGDKPVMTTMAAGTCP